jgi:hypothetical protein
VELVAVGLAMSVTMEGALTGQQTQAVAVAVLHLAFKVATAVLV